MPTTMVGTRGGGDAILRGISDAVLARRPAAIAVASAFVSTAGVSRLSALANRVGRPSVRLVAGTNLAVTHPRALRLALDLGWGLRIGQSVGGIFHPKLIVGGQRFDDGGSVVTPNLVYVGSGNLTIAGFGLSAECALCATEGDYLASASETFASYWGTGLAVDRPWIDAYEQRFLRRNRARSPSELDELGVTDGDPVAGQTIEQLRARRRGLPAAEHRAADGAWAGLRTFTGERYFQLEFPGASGQALAGMFGAPANGNITVQILCTDALERPMIFGWMRGNGMWRLNVPNDTPGVDRARAEQNGIMHIWRDPHALGAFRCELLPPGERHDEIIQRSTALGLSGFTPTREFGWF